MTDRYSHISLIEKLASLVVIVTRITDTVLGIQAKITESNKNLVELSVESVYHKYIKVCVKSEVITHDEMDKILSMSKDFFFKNRKMWNRLPGNKLDVYIKQELKNRTDIAY